MQEHLRQELLAFFVQIRFILRVRRVQVRKLHFYYCLQTIEVDTHVAGAEDILQYTSQRCRLLICCLKDLDGAILHIAVVGDFS